MVIAPALLALASTALLGAPPTERPCTPLGPKETLTLDLAEVPLADVARLMSCALERNILFQPGTLGSRVVTVLGPRPIGRRDLLNLWHTVLGNERLVEERHGAYWVVRPER